MTLPEPVIATLVKGIGAYMQVARPTDLPVSLRSLRGKHQKMLMARKRDIVAALDDEGFRALLVDWLDDKPSGIDKPVAAVLGIAARREDGWEGRLAGPVPAPVKALSKSDPSAALDREKERTRKAKDEARRAKEEAAREVAARTKEALASQAKIAELERKVGVLEAGVARTERDRDAARSEMDREVRKARRRAEKAEAALEEARSSMRTLRSEIAAKATPVAPPRKKGPAPSPVPSEPQRRKRLTVPKGRYEDAPETLTEWLSTPLVHLLIDGYNVSKAEGGFGDLPPESQRDLLLQEVGKVARRYKIKATVIFDGSDIPPGTSRRARGPVEVEYSRSDEIADDHLIAKLEGLPKHPVVVATNDKELQGRAARLGATIATSNQLLQLIR